MGTCESGIAVHFRSDSATALAWLANDMSSFNSHRARGAAMMLVVMRAKYGVMIYPKTSWIEGETQNIRADRHSRSEHLQPIPGAPLTRATPGTLVMESLNWCNPISLPESGGDICKIWTLMRDWCHKRVGLQ